MSEPTADTTQLRVSTAYRYYVLGLLFTVYLFNFMDRQILAILMEPIRQEFDLSDAQLGMLSGLIFAAFYTTLGIPIARLADRSSRVRIIYWSIAVWSAFTALTGFARNFWHLLAARIGVAVGEAGCNPAAYSIIADYFNRKSRATAISVYSLGVNVGSFCGLLVGANLASEYGWRTAFYIVGLPGLLLAIIVRLTLREPPRGFSEPTLVRAEPPPIRQVLTSLWAKKSFRHLSFAAGLHSFVAYGIGNFYAPFLQRSHHMTLQEAGNTLAVIYLVGGAIGTLLGGVLADKLAHKYQDARFLLWIPVVTLLLQFPISVTIYTTLDTHLVLILLTPAVALSAAYMAPTIAATYTLVGLRERAVASSLLLFVLNFIGLGLGPVVSGWLSDEFATYLIARGSDAAQAKADGLRWSMRVMVIANLWSVLHYCFAVRTLRQEAVAQPA